LHVGAPSGEDLPASQSEQDEDPAFSENFPASQCIQSIPSSSIWYCPLAHSEHAGFPTKDVDPSAQSVHVANPAAFAY
jgi:hypothetical protein